MDFEIEYNFVEQKESLEMWAIVSAIVFFKQRTVCIIKPMGLCGNLAKQFCVGFFSKFLFHFAFNLILLQAALIKRQPVLYIIKV